MIKPMVAGTIADSNSEVMLAFGQALNAIEPVAKSETADTGKYTYRYVNLSAVLEEVKRVCQMFNLAITQIPSVDKDNGMLTVTAVLIHGGGQILDFPPIMLKMPADAQAVGSALTYLRRYQLLTLFGMETEDDDGGRATAAMKPEPTGRTREEAFIRGEMAKLTPEQRSAMQEQFKFYFNSSLAELPVSRHEEAAQWFKEQMEKGEQTP